MSSQVLSFEVALDLIFELINKKTNRKNSKYERKVSRVFFSTLQRFNLGKIFLKYSSWEVAKTPK